MIEINRHPRVDIVVLAKDGEEHLCYEVGLHTAWSELGTKPQPTGRSPIRSLLWGDLPYLLTDDALADERFHFAGAIDEPIFAAELRSRIIVSLRVQGSVIGSLNISSHGIGTYKKDDVRLRRTGNATPDEFARSRGRNRNLERKPGRLGQPLGRRVSHGRYIAPGYLGERDAARLAAGSIRIAWP